MDTVKLTRQSAQGVKYQIEYRQAPASTESEYRVRRGTCGTHTAWIKTKDIKSILNTLGFGTGAANSAHDYSFEALLSRGVITLNKEVVARLARTSGTNKLSKRLYGRLKRFSEETWTLPSGAISDKQIYEYLRKIIIQKLDK